MRIVFDAIIYATKSFYSIDWSKNEWLCFPHGRNACKLCRVGKLTQKQKRKMVYDNAKKKKKKKENNVFPSADRTRSGFTLFAIYKTVSDTSAGTRGVQICSNMNATGLIFRSAQQSMPKSLSQSFKILASM